MCKKIVLVFFLWCFLLPVFSQDIYTVSTKNIKAKIPSTLWGLFFEDINRGADGGLYGEMVENRSFDFPKPMTAWDEWPSQRLRDGIFVVTNQITSNDVNPKYLSVNLQPTDTVGLINTGFDEGMAFTKDLPYSLTLRYRQTMPGVHIRAILLNAMNRSLAEVSITPSNKNGWQEQQIHLVSKDNAAKGKLLIIFEGAGRMDVDRISLFPTDTWKNRPGGLRRDLVQKLYELHPGFLRFPGGCIVEGNTLDQRYQWKQTIGNIDARKTMASVWSDRIGQRPAPDYFQSNGLGFFEYFQLCDDIGASPLPILNCGMSCQFTEAEVAPLIGNGGLDPYVQDALDLIEFANGDSKTKWGQKRISLGHTASFNMKMLGVGNENWGPQYAERLAVFTKAIKQKYPYMQIVNATGYSRIAPVFKYMDSVLRARKVDIIDEHFYASPEWFYANSKRYDQYDRKGPKIFVGEYAAQSDGVGSLKNTNNLQSALSEAAFMTGIERNADIVSMASYAPLFAHVSGWQWTPNLIWFDNASSYNTPNYYVQQLFSLNKGTGMASVLSNGKAIEGQDSVWASAVTDQSTHEIIIKLVNGSSVVKQKKMEIPGLETITGTITGIWGDPKTVNSLSSPATIEPKTKNIYTDAKNFVLDLPAYSFSVVRIKNQP